MSESKSKLRREALARQGTIVSVRGRRYKFLGNQAKAEFEEGGEGLVQPVREEQGYSRYRVKCFWEPNNNRKYRSSLLTQNPLANPNKEYADALAGAPVEIWEQLGAYTPFAVVMKEVRGRSWKSLREAASVAEKYPLPDWPLLSIRATWAYGLATAVKQMEERQFIHADLSPGNVMVTPDGERAGDMALVDFDSFVLPAMSQMDVTMRGSDGYAAPEIWQGQYAKVGSDRIGLAILIQEFLLIGEPSISADEAFQWAYDQESEIVAANAEAHPAVRRLWPEIATLVEKTLCTRNLMERPAPEAWRKALLPLAEASPVSVPSTVKGAELRNIILIGYPVQTSTFYRIPDHERRVDLLLSSFRLRSTLERDVSGGVTLLVHPGGELRVQIPGYKRWHIYQGGARIPLNKYRDREIGLVRRARYEKEYKCQVSRHRGLKSLTTSWTP
jgi:serine/threonine protein kinase